MFIFEKALEIILKNEQNQIIRFNYKLLQFVLTESSHNTSANKKKMSVF